MRFLMKKTKIFDTKGNLLAIHVIESATKNSSYFVTDECNNLQVGFFEREKNHKIKAHKHNKQIREIIGKELALLKVKEK